MNYNYDEWKIIKQRGLKKFIFDIKNLILIFFLITVFAITNLLTRKVIILSKEFLIHFAIIIVILTILWIVTQLIKWNTYIIVFDKNKKWRFFSIRFYEILIGVLNLWIPIGILASTYGIDYTSAIWRINCLNFDYISKFIIYISVKCVLWVIGGTLFELIILNADDNYNRKNHENFIIINKYI